VHNTLILKTQFWREEGEMNRRGILAFALLSAIITALLAVAPVTADWMRSAKLGASDADASNYFGSSVAISGDTAVVGAFGKADNMALAYVFTRNGTTWNQQAKLNAGEAVAVDEFEVSVAISCDTVVVGADGEADNMGAAYVFVRSGATWSQQAKLTASDGEGNSPLGDLGDFFGSSVAINGDTIVVGAESKGTSMGAAYVFTRNGTIWNQQAKLTASDAEAGDLFGASVAIRSDVVAVGADGESDHTGAAYVFTRSGTTWSQQAKLTASDGAPGDSLASVAISGDTVVAGAGRKADNMGAAYVFVRSGTTWSQQAKLTASDAEAGDLFGRSVAVSGNTTVVGVSEEANGRGAVYVFIRAGTSWTQEEKITTGDAITGSYFGWSVSADNGTMLVGMPSLGGQNAAPGASYVYWNPVTPVVSTAEAVSVTTSSATLNGTLTSLGTAASVAVSFEYGLTCSYGSATGVQYTTVVGPFSATINDLVPGTTYHFRAKADGGIRGTAAGLDMTFTTSTPTSIPVPTPTPAPTPTSTPTLTPTPAPTPTSTPTLTPTPTAVSPPPTLTPTGVPPTAMPTTTPAPEDKGTNIWVIIGPILGAIVIGVTIYWFLRQRMTRT
jgi:hypothetical protein